MPGDTTLVDVTPLAHAGLACFPLGNVSDPGAYSGDNAKIYVDAAPGGDSSHLIRNFRRLYLNLSQ
jgi:hypothetical protein